MNCPNCNTKMIGKKENHYPFVQSGLDDVYIGGVMHWKCPNCGEGEVEIPNPLGLQREIAKLLLAKTKLNAKEFRYLRTFMGYSSHDFAHIVNRSRETITRYENGSLAIPAEMDYAIRYLVLTGAEKRNYEYFDMKEISKCRKQFSKIEAHFKSAWKVSEKSA